MIEYRPSWQNAVADDVAQRKIYSDKLTVVYQMIAKCGNSAGGCKEKTGKTINNWRDDRDRYAKLIAGLDKKIAAESTTLTAAEKLKTQQAIAAQEVGKSELIAASTGTQNTTKYILIGAAFIAVVVGGIFLIKKLRKGQII
jgi:LPXTG-motif cell wall-anchored protein